MSEVLSRGLAWHYAHRDESLQRMADWRRTNAERKREYDRAYRAKRREDHRRWAKAYRLANPDRVAAQVAAGNANLRAKRLGIAGRLTVQDIADLWERQPTCGLCGLGRGVDHIVPLAAGGSNEPPNLRTLCTPCNSKAHIRTMPRGYHGRLAKL